jgi:uncharacterized protein YheU (UPF0270 family)
MRKLTRRQLRNLISEAIFREGYGIDTGSKKREIGNSSFEKAQEDAKKNGKSYFVNKKDEVIVFDEDGNASKKPDMSNKDAFDAADGTVHYVGSL